MGKSPINGPFSIAMFDYRDYRRLLFAEIRASDVRPVQVRFGEEELQLWQEDPEAPAMGDYPKDSSGKSGHPSFFCGLAAGLNAAHLHI